MYEKIAWENFYKTGNVESFLEYKYLKNKLMLGEDESEANQSKGNNNKGNALQG